MRPVSARKPLPLHATDLPGLARLATTATLGVVDVVEAMHHTILRGTGPLGRAPQGRAPGLTGFVYGAVRGVTRLSGRGAEALLGQTARWLPAADSPPARDALLAALNGVWGDHLAASGNPLAIPMRLRLDGQPLTLDRAALAVRLPAAGPRLLVLVHGLCMNDRQWQRDGHDHGRSLAQGLGYSPLYLHYNSGRHVSTNGREFAALLEQLLQAWPVPVTELVILGHSMGGLVTRSACHLAIEQGMAWPKHLRAMVFLGTPHHGAPLERPGAGAAGARRPPIRGGRRQPLGPAEPARSPRAAPALAGLIFDGGGERHTRRTRGPERGATGRDRTCDAAFGGPHDIHFTTVARQGADCMRPAPVRP